MSRETIVTVQMSEHQAQVMRDALELYTRMGLGQIDYLAELVRFNVISFSNDISKSHDKVDAIEKLSQDIKAVLGHPKNGSFGIGNKKLPPSIGVGYEMQKMIDKALSYHRNPNPDFKTTNYDGVGPRYSDQPLLEIKIEESGLDLKM